MKRESVVDPLKIHIQCEKCQRNLVEWARNDEDTVAKLIARVTKYFYVEYQMKIVDRLRGTDKV